MSEVLILKKRKDFVRVAKQGYKMVASTVILQAAQNLCAEDNSCRVGYTSTKKIGKAHLRNRTRRRLRAAVREVFPERALPNTDYVLIGRYNTASCPFEKLSGDISWALKKINKLIIGGEKADAETHPQSADTAD